MDPELQAQLVQEVIGFTLMDDDGLWSSEGFEVDNNG